MAEKADMGQQQKYQIGVIGRGRDLSRDIMDEAFNIGRLIAEHGHILICGGHDGVMKAAARGAKEHGGLTVGILMSYDKSQANPYIDICIPTGLYHARNVLVAASCDILIAIDGGVGTLSEIAFAIKLGKTIIGLNTWSAFSEHYGDLNIIQVNSANEAIDAALNALKSKE